ncbi:HAMP domain-containing sensor histidine kinase [Methylosinus sp. KRF6]|uniref:sensor histidine kinase n=1 Tax=Methylosinus sp. KRF6 TaxID=2846853 RepID=UPI001C0D1FB6|nr:HAMP domain-containing histidine kinase [Methylosinus sp. KRF6]
MRRSLSFRLVAVLLSAQVIAFGAIPLFTFLISISGGAPASNMTINDWAQGHAYDLVVGSLVRAADGSVRLDASPALRAYMAEQPRLRVAAIDARTRAVAHGSSPELAATLAGLGKIEAASLRFHISDDEDENSRGYAYRTAPPFEDMLIAVYGYSFQWNDLLFVIGSLFSIPGLLSASPMIFGAVAIAWLMVRRGLAPLRAAAAEVSRIDLDSLDQRIPQAGIPGEVAPFVTAVNQAIDRLSAGVATQRRFTANAAHELRTPVAILRARLETYDDVTFTQELKRDVRRIQTIVEQLLTAARISNAESAMDEELDLSAIVLTMVADYMPLVIENRRHIEFDPPPSTVLVRGNRRALECVVANLIDNALRAEPEGGTVLVQVGRDATIRVIDHGEGISHDELSKIFEPFWRKDEHSRGTGLGLSIAKDLVELHAGMISVTPTPGGGATFEVSLERILT